MTDLSWQEFVTEPEPGVIEFVLKTEHVKLLRNMRIQWNDTAPGAPQINPERPYGSRTFYSAIIDILELDERSDAEFYKELAQLHRETAVALQVILKTGKFKATTYRADKFTQDWKEYNPNGRKSKQAKLDLVEE